MARLPRSAAQSSSCLHLNWTGVLRPIAVRLIGCSPSPSPICSCCLRPFWRITAAVHSCRITACAPSMFRRADMRYGSLTAVLLAATTLGGCDGVLDPKGPIALAERQILFNATGIMLAIVIPVVIATLGIAFWFRTSNKRATYRPDFTDSGRIEILVWSIPLMTVLLTGMVAWIGSYDLDPPKPIASSVKPVKVQAVSLDWKWLFIYPEHGIASVNRLTIPAGTPVNFE